MANAISNKRVVLENKIKEMFQEHKINDNDLQQIKDIKKEAKQEAKERNPIDKLDVNLDLVSFDKASPEEFFMSCIPVFGIGTLIEPLLQNLTDYDVPESIGLLIASAWFPVGVAALAVNSVVQGVKTGVNALITLGERRDDFNKIYTGKLEKFVHEHTPCKTTPDIMSGECVKSYRVKII